MSTMIYPIKMTLSRMIAGVMLTVLCAGCINDSSSCDEPGVPEPEIGLRFTVVTRQPGGSRAADISGHEEGTKAENYINLADNDIRFLLFDAAGKLLREFTPDTDVAPVDGTNYVKYTVKATVKEPYFDDVASRDVDFYIMVFANTAPYNYPYQPLVPGTTTIEDVMNSKLAYTMPVYVEINWARSGWRPSDPGSRNGQYIPMAGLQKFTLVKGAFDAAGPEGFVNLSPDSGDKDINMLRSMAKIEVIDKIEADRDLSIQKVELLGYFGTATLLPSYNQWNRNAVLETQQVVMPTMAATPDYKEPNADWKLTTPGTIVDFYEDELLEERPVFSVFTSEYSLTEAGTRVHPYLRVTVTDPNTPAGSESPIYLLRLAESYSPDGVASQNDIPALLRNHIYRYEVTGVNTETSLDVRYTVCNWEEESVDIPSFE